MNIEELIVKAGEAIAVFSRKHTTACFLWIVNGEVVALPKKDTFESKHNYLLVTKWQQLNGLTAAQWENIGQNLLNQYNEEKAWQTRQKH